MAKQIRTKWSAPKRRIGAERGLSPWAIEVKVMLSLCTSRSHIDIIYNIFDCKWTCHPVAMVINVHKYEIYVE